MPKIEVKHTSIVINNYEQGDNAQLERTFSVYDSLYHTRFIKGMEFIPEENKAIIPRGVDIFWVEKLFNDFADMNTKHDPMDTIEPIMIKYLPRDDRQKEALKFMLGMENYKNNKYKSQLSVNLNTGFGKSYCAIATVSYLKLRSMVIAGNNNVLDQWKNYILEYTDTKKNEIYNIIGSYSIEKLFRMSDKELSKIKLLLASHGTIRSYGEANGWSKITELFNKLKIGIKIFDEAHLFFDNMCKIDFYTNTFRTYYLTATPQRSNNEEDIIYQYYFKNIPKIDLFDEDQDPHTHYRSIIFTSEPTPSEVSACKNKYGLDRNAYTNYLMNKENYYKILHVVLDLALKHNGKTLIYIGTNDAITKTYEWIIENYPELSDSIGIYTSIIDNAVKAQQLEKRIILSTTKSCGAAMDIKGLKMTIVLAEPFKSEVLARQTLGRTRADNTFYIDIVDRGFAQINKFYYYKKDTFKKYALSCEEIKMPKDILNAKVEQLLEARKSIRQTAMLINPIVTGVAGMINPIYVGQPGMINPIEIDR